MQNASNAYKQSIQGLKRNRGHIRVTIGVINQTAQYSATAVNTHNDLIYFSLPNANDVFKGASDAQLYATDEQDFTKVDGSMYFAPDENSGMKYLKNGIVTENLLTPIYITFNGLDGFDIKGLTFDFSECYPTSVRIQTNNVDRTYDVEANGGQYFHIKDDGDIFTDTDYFIITPIAMKNGQGRMRILSMNFGVSNIFADGNVLDFTSKEYVSPITDSIPSRDLSITIDNRNQYYSPDNPESEIAYMEVGQKVTTQFGYDLDESGTSVEWIKETTTYLSEWSATDTDATFTATDLFYSMTGTYYKGMYRNGGISLYDLAEDVLTDAGITGYYLDPYLKDVLVYNPLPPVNHATALQIIANAGRCVLSESREGWVSLKSSFMPDITVTTNGEASFSVAQNIVDGEPKDAYAHDSYAFTPVDGSMYFAPDSNFRHVGYYSESIYVSDPTPLGQNLPIGAVNVFLAATEQATQAYWSDGEPVVTLNLEAEYSAYGLKILFRELAPTRFKVETFYEGTGVTTKTYTNNDTYWSTDDVFMSFDEMRITFLEGTANARVVIDNISLGEMTDYTIERKQMMDTPTAMRQRKVKAITVVRNTYQLATDTEEISNEAITVSSEQNTYDVYFTNPYGNLAATVDESGVTVSITESSSYHAKLTFSGISGTRTIHYHLTGKQYTTSELSVTKNYNPDGEEIVWSNPLISTTEQANDLIDWLNSYYAGDVQYEIEWRGDPRLDANDLIYVELKDRDNALVRSYQNEISYNGAWRGAIQARKVVLEDGT